MSAEPHLDPAAMLQLLLDAYGLDLHHLTFLPEGTAPAYRAEGPGGRFFLKVLPDTPYGREATARIRRELPLLQALQDTGVLMQVPTPVPSLQGSRLTRAQDHTLVVYRWIEGVAVGAHWKAVLPELAGLLGRLHQHSAHLLQRAPHLPVEPEDFGLPFEKQLLQNLQLLQTPLPHAGPGHPALQDLLLPRASALQALLQQARGLQAKARRRALPQVICHTDAHGGNVLRDLAGQLWIIDWETARLAPPEHDLWMFEDRLPEVWTHHQEQARLNRKLDPDVLGFYFCRRVLEDLALDVQLVLHEHTHPAQIQASLWVLQKHILPAWDTLPEKLQLLAHWATEH